MSAGYCAVSLRYSNSMGMSDEAEADEWCDKDEHAEYCLLSLKGLEWRL